MRFNGQVIRLCAGVGVRYGAAAGALYCALLVLGGAIWASLQTAELRPLVVSPLVAIIWGLFGIPFGALAGACCGFLGGVMRGPVGWGLAGALGGAAAGTPTAGMFEVVAELEGPSTPFPDPLVWITWALLPALIGAATGAAIGAGLRRKSSPLPLVTRLAADIEAVEEAECRALGGPTELLPAAAPPGRGDEAVPTASSDLD